MDDTEEAQAWIEAVTHDLFDDSLSFLANRKTGARASPQFARPRRAARPGTCKPDQRDQAR